MALNRQELENLKNLVNPRLEELISKFVPEYFLSDKLLIAPCPIHEGDNESAFNINIDPDDEYCGRWFCNTRGCSDDLPNDVLGFLEAKLGNFSAAVTLLEEFLKVKPGELDKACVHYDQITKFLTRKRKGSRQLLTRGEIRKRLLIPAMYYVQKRGFNPETLDHFDVGFCLNEKSQMYKRVVFPVFDETDEYMIGCVGRATNSQSKFKWINSKGFNKASHVYNYGKAVIEARQCGELILCEGQGDVMRLWEAGVKNAVGMFGCSVSDDQQRLLEQTGVFNLVLAFDPDKAGEKGRDKVIEKCGQLFNIKQITLPDDRDIGDLNECEIREMLCMPQR
jgi:5S rRNA maturation endonuclease (ribonuclease M5)